MACLVTFPNEQMAAFHFKRNPDKAEFSPVDPKQLFCGARTCEPILNLISDPESAFLFGGMNENVWDNLKNFLSPPPSPGGEINFLPNSS